MKPVDKKRFDLAVIGITFMLAAILIMQVLIQTVVPDTPSTLILIIPLFVFFTGVALVKMAVD